MTVLHRSGPFLPLMLAGTVLILGYMFGQHVAPPVRIGTSQDPATATQTPGATPTSSWPSPIYTEQDAIDQALGRFPEGFSPHSEVARLVTTDTYDIWSETRALDAAYALNGDAPVWLVGILGDSLLRSDIMSVVGMPVPETLDTSVAGGFYAWDANSGALIGLGVLAPIDEWPQNYGSLCALKNEPLSITLATPRPTLGPTVTPTP